MIVVTTQFMHALAQAKNTPHVSPSQVITGTHTFMKNHQDATKGHARHRQNALQMHLQGLLISSSVKSLLFGRREVKE